MNTQVLDKLSQKGEKSFTSDYSVMYQGKRIKLEEYLIMKEQKAVWELFRSKK
ncbi:hypothetical protein [Tepidibacillus sp. LV47]|uniref:hypothetical protein n=1 Tax=Tepidibacillus sp. LV47 TaxID=3398228 RepID=UPI003AAE9247